jgi:two-component SAPR family response regulator
MIAKGLRVLVVEDELAIAQLIVKWLVELGHQPVGPVGKLSAGLELAETATLDAAVLDVNIRGGQVFPIAECLMARNIPFVLASGYSDWALPVRLRGQHRLIKPFYIGELRDTLALLCAADTSAVQRGTDIATPGRDDVAMSDTAFGRPPISPA